MINLLPKQYKEEFKYQEKLSLVLVLSVIILVFSVSLFLVLFYIKTYIQVQVELFGNFIEEIDSKFSKEDENLQKINNSFEEVSNLLSFYKENKYLTETLDEIFKIIPKGIYLNSLSWDSKTGLFSLTGFSAKREDLLELRERLRLKENVNEINFPPQNFVKSSNIDFQISFKIK